MLATSKLSHDQSNPKSSSCNSVSSQVSIHGKLMIQGCFRHYSVDLCSLLLCL